MSQKGYEIGTLIGTIDPQSLNGAEYTDVIDMSDFDQVTFYFLFGADANAPTITVAVQTCDDGGTNAADFKTADALESDNTASAGGQIIINMSAEDLAGGDINEDRYVRGRITTGAAALVACAVVGYMPKHAPGHADVPDLASVIEIEDDIDE
jgi:hypothetical protein